MDKIRIVSVVEGSIAEELDIRSGDYLLAINGQQIKDIFDYNFLIQDEELTIDIQTSDGELVECAIEKEEDEDLGLEFENDLIEDAKSCCNGCIFCFIDQLPKGMRNTLYFKDDDSRLSFLTGNYVTLTNVTKDDLQRIINYKMSPINVSVHTVDKDLRAMMLRNKTAGDVLDKIKMLTNACIEVNCQIVLCRGVNDGKFLDQTIIELSNLYPGVRSVSVVPVGITRYREGLYKLKAFDKESASNVIRQVKAHQNKNLDEKGTRMVYLADEFYIKANESIPQFFEYEDFPQIENGVGLMANFKSEVLEFLEENKDLYSKELEDDLSIATGICSYNMLNEVCMILTDIYKNIKIKLYPISNEFFGSDVTVTGLLTGEDLINQLKGKELGNRLLISKSMLKADTDLFLDDYRLSDVKDGLDVNVDVVDNCGREFVKKVLGGNLCQDQ